MEAIVKQAEFSREQIDLIKKTVAVGASDLELKLFMYQAQRTGLDPLSKQIHFIKRAGSGTIQTGIDGYRVIAERTGTYAGNDEPTFEEDGRIFPIKATVTVYRIIAGQRCPFTATAFWDEYYPGEGAQGFFWRKMPRGQLAKCAEALALRKAFPNDLSGLYITEEMQQSAKEPASDPHPTDPSLTLDKSVSQEPPPQATPTAKQPLFPSNPPSGKTDEAKIEMGDGGMACIRGNLTEIGPVRKSSGGKEYIQLRICDTQVSVWDKKLFDTCRNYATMDVKAFVTVQKKGADVYYNLTAIVPEKMTTEEVAKGQRNLAENEDIPF